MKVYVPIYSSGYEKREFNTVIPGIFYTKKDAMKRLIVLMVKQRLDLDSYNERVGDGDRAYLVISEDKELETTEELVNGLVRYVEEDISRLIEVADDSYYKDGWTIRIDEMEVE